MANAKEQPLAALLERWKAEGIADHVVVEMIHDFEKALKLQRKLWQAARRQVAPRGCDIDPVSRGMATGFRLCCEDLQGVGREDHVPEEPVPMVLTCIVCGERHIDEGKFATLPHHTHSCQTCGVSWRPAIEPTVGVLFLPGFKNPEPELLAQAQVDQAHANLNLYEGIGELRDQPLLQLLRLWKVWNGIGTKLVRLFPLIGQLERALSKQRAIWESTLAPREKCIDDLGHKPCPDPE